MYDILGFEIDEESNEGYDLILVDGMNVLHRAAHAHSDLAVVTSDGDYVLTGATYGFISIVKGVWERYAKDPERSKLIICWDGGYRHRLKLYEGYKANRRAKKEEDMEDYQSDLPSQRKALWRILRVAGWCQAVADGFEADDVMATLARQNAGKYIAIYTMDQDLHQCVTDKTHVISPKWGATQETIWTPEAVKERWGVPPHRVPEVKALAGDSADDIPGCPGCGPGWAKKLLASADHHLTEVIARAKIGTLVGEYQGKKWKTPAITEKILGNESLIMTSWALAKVVDDAPVELTHPPPDPERLKAAFRILRFHSFLHEPTFRVLRQIA